MSAVLERVTGEIKVEEAVYEYRKLPTNFRRSAHLHPDVVYDKGIFYKKKLIKPEVRVFRNHWALGRPNKNGGLDLDDPESITVVCGLLRITSKKSLNRFGHNHPPCQKCEDAIAVPAFQSILKNEWVLSEFPNTNSVEHPTQDHGIETYTLDELAMEFTYDKYGRNLDWGEMPWLIKPKMLDLK